MSAHNICFYGEIRKKNMWITPLIWSYDLNMYYMPTNSNNPDKIKLKNV